MSEVIIEELKNLESKDKARKRAREHYYKYKETHLKATKLWKDKNPEKVKEYEKKRYERRKLLKEENEKYKQEIERLNNIIKRLEEDLREMYLTFGEFSEEYTEKKIQELKEMNK